MIRFFHLLFLSVLLGGILRADDPAAFAAVRAADDRRIAATIAADIPTLSQLLSDDLHYANSDGRLQTKAQFLAAVKGSTARYVSVVPQNVKLQAIAVGAVAMSGRAQITAETGGERVRFTLQFLAAWREEAGEWRLLAYQSTPVPEATPTSPPPNP